MTQLDLNFYTQSDSSILYFLLLQQPLPICQASKLMGKKHPKTQYRHKDRMLKEHSIQKIPSTTSHYEALPRPILQQINHLTTQKNTPLTPFEQTIETHLLTSNLFKIFLNNYNVDPKQPINAIQKILEIHDIFTTYIIQTRKQIKNNCHKALAPYPFPITERHAQQAYEHLTKLEKEEKKKMMAHLQNISDTTNKNHLSNYEAGTIALKKTDLIFTCLSDHHLNKIQELSGLGALITELISVQQLDPAHFKNTVQQKGQKNYDYTQQKNLYTPHVNSSVNTSKLKEPKIK